MSIKLKGESVKKPLSGVDKVNKFFRPEKISVDKIDDNIERRHSFDSKKKTDKKNTEHDREEDLVMIMMPKITWNAFQELAEKYGGTPSQAIGTALKLLEETLKNKSGEK